MHLIRCDKCGTEVRVTGYLRFRLDLTKDTRSHVPGDAIWLEDAPDLGRDCKAPKTVELCLSCAGNLAIEFGLAPVPAPEPVVS